MHPTVAAAAAGAVQVQVSHHPAAVAVTVLCRDLNVKVDADKIASRYVDEFERFSFMSVQVVPCCIGGLDRVYLHMNSHYAYVHEIKHCHQMDP